MKNEENRQGLKAVFPNLLQSDFSSVHGMSIFMGVRESLFVMNLLLSVLQTQVV